MEVNQLICGDSLEVMRTMQRKSVDLVLGSPPYENRRAYGGLRSRVGQEWVDWMVDIFREAVRVSRGLVAMVVEGFTRNFEWSAVPAMLIADMKRLCGADGKPVFRIRKPPLYVRDGIPGSGGTDWLKNKYEFIVCATSRDIKKLPWSDQTAMGHPPKFGPGGPPSHRLPDGSRANGCKATDRRPSGELKARVYVPPKLANPGNLIFCGPGGGGHLGDKAAHSNEAPFPERIPEFLIRSFCPPSGIVLDPFLGSGTSAKVAAALNRRYIGIDCRESQIELSKRRLAEAGERS
jgi:hypothetical protein